MDIKLTDNSEEVKAALEAAVIRALERCGDKAEGYAVDLCPYNMGNLKDSISHAVDSREMAVYVGTNSEYGVYVEMGTGIYAEGGGGRPTPWVYQDAKGNYHWTRGNRARPFIKPAVAGNEDTYIQILEDEMRNG